MQDWILDLMAQLGYAGIALLMLLENVFPPIPSELIMPAAGFTAAQGQLSLVGVIIAGTVGSVLGALFWYGVGRVFDEARLCQWADRYGRYVMISAKDIHTADDWFDRYGNKIVFFGRFIPAIRSLVSLPAGMSNMKLAPFLLYSSLGSSIWTGALAYAGFALGEHYDQIEAWIGSISQVVLGGMVLALGWFFWRQYHKKHG